MPRLKTIQWLDDAARIIDQTRLPGELAYLDIRNADEMFDAIKALKIRGAPAIGIAAAFGLYLGIRDYSEKAPVEGLMKFVREKADFLASARPTAVNLSWALERLQKKVSQVAEQGVNKIKTALFEEAQKILEEDIQTCRKIGEYGFEQIKNYHAILTHCNAGSLATGEYGTALAAIYVGKEKGKIFHMYADETRPLLQGSRITAFELMAAGIPVTLICDNMAAAVMAMGKVDAVLVGADRIAANGDAANKIGTYGLALVARAHALPFYVAAPFSTFDLSIKTGKEIPIELRDAGEIINSFGKLTAPANVNVFNPAFDVTPHDLITAIITERGVVLPPFEENIRTMFSGPDLV
jgi:S-methyl-5-thioribose-1-phosphate isomerase